MGVKNLWKLLHPTCSISFPKNEKLAIDTSIWLHYYKNIPQNLFVFHTCKRILKLLLHNNKPIFVFDTQIPEAKKKTIIERQKTNIADLARKYLKNEICKICELPYKQCKHAAVEKIEILNERDLQVKEKIKEERPEQWGINVDNEIKEGKVIYFDKNKSFDYNLNLKERFNMVSDKCQEEFFESDKMHKDHFTMKEISSNHNENSNTYKKRKIDNRRYFEDEISFLEKDEFSKLSKNKQLKILVSLREKRKMPLRSEKDEGLEFCIEQINNVRQRNKISAMIKKLSGEDKRIMSDCDNVFYFNEIQTVKNFIHNVKDKNIKKEEMNFENKIDDAKNEKYIEEDFLKIFEDAEEQKQLDHNNLIHEKTDYLNNNDTKNKFLALEEDIEDNFLDIFNNDTVKKSNNSMEILEAENIFTQTKNETTLSDNIIIDDVEKLSESQSTVDDDLDFSDLINFKPEDYKINEKEFDNNFNNTKKEENLKNYNEVVTNLSSLINTKDQIIKFELKNQNDNHIIDEIYINDDYNSDVNILSSKIKDILLAFNLPFIDSLLEADSQCAYLNERNLVDAVITEDNDVFLYGCKKVYKNYFKKNKDIEMYEMCKIENILSRDEMVKMSYLLGSDYTVGIKGIGIKNAFIKLKNNEIEDNDTKFLFNLYYGNLYKEIKEIEWKNICKTKINNFLNRSGLSASEKNEILFYVNKLK
ncbi:hypothetical protein GVAV_001392 [Gurleya vavrai]